MATYDFYYKAKEKKDAPTIHLDKEQEETRRQDYEEVIGMKDHHNEQHADWEKAGNFYNIVQSGEGADSISRFAVGLSRTIIDAGISMMNEGNPSAEFAPIGPANKKISVLWNALAEHQLNKSNWPQHQKLFTTDLHVFGTSSLESYVNPVVRRPNESPELFFIRLATEPRTGIRHRSIWRTFRNPNVIDPDDVGSCSWEEEMTHAEWVSKFAGRSDFDTKQIPVASKYKLTHITNEYENTYRIYCLPFGKMAEAAMEEQPDNDELGYPVYSKRLTSLNPLGKCPISFGTFGDKLTRDYKQHSLYGMGIPQLIEGMEMIMEGLFNMTVDNMRQKNTVVVGYQPYQGQTEFPDLDNIGYMESGRVFNGTFNPQSLGIADLQSNTVLWEWINNLCIWITGYNFQQIGGDTSKTAYEFSQRLKANSQRASSRLKGLENGVMKRSFHMLLANTLSQIKAEEWDTVTDTKASEIADMLKSGKVSSSDYEVIGGKVKRKKFVEYFPVKDHVISEKFTQSQKRSLSQDTVKNTIEFSPKKGEESMVPAVAEYLFPNGDIAHMLAFTTTVNSKTMLGDMKVTDQQAIEKALSSGASLMQVVPGITPEMIYGLWKQSAEKAGLDVEAVSDGDEKSDMMKAAEQAMQKIEEINSQPQVPSMAAMPPTQGSAPAPTAQLAGAPAGI